MSRHWFLVESIPPEGGEADLPAEEAAHLRPRRLRVGDSITLFDGAGVVAEAQLLTPRGGTRILARRTAPAPPALVVASALPKGDRVATMLDMTTQLGMTTFVPLRCARSVVTATSNARRRWARVCHEACKQSRWPWSPELAAEEEPLAVVESQRAQGALVCLGDGRGEPITQALAGVAPHDPVCVVIGPEGGLTADEHDQVVRAGATPVAIGAGVLRVEAAATALAAAVTAQRTSPSTDDPVSPPSS